MKGYFEAINPTQLLEIPKDPLDFFQIHKVSETFKTHLIPP